MLCQLSQVHLNDRQKVTSQIRIIGGEWRGRKLQVVDVEGLRPTPDRIRETLFNWLASRCRDSIVLDCFAGSGALGFEAISRGARQLISCEQNLAAAANLQTLTQRLKSDRVKIFKGDVCDQIEHLNCRFDLVFIDPPYANPDLREKVFWLLEQNHCLQVGAVIYFEWPKSTDFSLPSSELRWIKQKSDGRVHYAIAEWRGSG